MNRRQNRRLLEALTLEQDAAVLAAVLAEDVVLLDQAQERSFVGREAVITFLHTFFIHGFTQTEARIQTMIVEETEAAVVFTFYGRQDGPFMGIPPTWQEVVLPMVVYCQIESGRIKQATLYYNAGTLLRQIGLGL
jgi:steroid delta-isomerase-like uncharacterized protein